MENYISRSNSIDRIYQDFFVIFLEAIGLDGYGYLNNKINLEYRNERGGISTEKFEILPYYWGEEEEEINKPNFYYKPKNIYLEWYKYPLRSSYSNIKLNKKLLIEIVKDCISSINIDKESLSENLKDPNVNILAKKMFKKVLEG